MKKRLFIYTTLLVSAGLFCFFGLSVYINYTGNLRFAKDSVIKTTQIYSNLYQDRLDLAHFVTAGDETRITVISPDGQVLADSFPLDMEALENHLARPEVKAAQMGAPEVYVRHSATLGMDLIYYALKVNSGDSYVFIRVAVPVAKINEYLFQSLPLLVFLLAIIAIVCFMLARGMANRVVSPLGAIEKKLRLLAEGEGIPEDTEESDEEISPITREIDNIAHILQENLHNLRDEKSKLDYVLNNIGDGIIAVNAEKNIMLVNAAVLGIFGATAEVTGKQISYLTYEKPLIQAITDCVETGRNTLLSLTIQGRIYSVGVKRLPGSALTMTVMSDVTEINENAKRREEFFANSSHELKTPLTAISGFNELLAIHNQDAQLTKLIDGITRETNRMLSLIADMLKLSALENGPQINPVSVSLSKLIQEAYEAVSAVSSGKPVTFDTVGDGTVMAEPAHVYELVKNLIENAIRYNHPNGRVRVTVDCLDRHVRMTVADSGIGISPEDQSRIFERFYRVEKSRSSKNGGTGLGLSIVKHICVLYDWRLSLKSKPGVGTEIVVVFPSESEPHNPNEIKPASN